MVNIIQDAAGVDFMTEKDIVTELLLTTKNVLNRYCFALGETANPELRETLKGQINKLIDSQSRLINYAVEKGYYLPYNPLEQFKDDLKKAYTALDLEPWKLESTEDYYGPKRDLPIVRS